MAMNVATEHEQFQIYLTRNLRYLTQCFAHPEPIPPDELRRQALHTLSYALDMPSAWQATRDLLLALAPRMEQAGHRYDWLPYLERANQVSKQLHDLQTVAELTLQQGILYRLLSEFALAQSHLQRSIELCQQLNANRNQARALNEIAWVEYLQQQTELATAHVNQAITLLPTHDPERAMCYRVQGMIAITHEQWVEAETLHRQALAIFESQGDQRKVAWSLQNLAYALRGQERFDEAIGYYEQAAQLLQQMGDLYHWSVVQMNLGITYYYSGRYTIAINYYSTSQSIPKNLLDKFQLARLRFNTALSLMMLFQYSEAEIAFQEAIHLYKDLNAISWQLNAIDGLAMNYIGWEKYDLAIEVLEQAFTELPNIIDAPNYTYLANSLQKHLKEAQIGQKCSP